MTAKFEMCRLSMERNRITYYYSSKDLVCVYKPNDFLSKFYKNIQLLAILASERNSEGRIEDVLAVLLENGWEPYAVCFAKEEGEVHFLRKCIGV